MKTFSDFWPFYCLEHRKPLTRRLHFMGSLLGPVAAAAVFLRTGSAHAFWLWALCGYGFAWFAHVFVEKNRPATFTHPFYSLASDYVMVWKMLTGKMDEEVSRALEGQKAV
jgi:hypothetical protein